MKKITVLENQNIMDIVLQEYGSPAALVGFCLDNAIHPDDDVEPGQEVIIDENRIVRPQIVQYLKERGIAIATGIVEDDVIVSGGIGEMVIGSSFIIS
jgi:hypothetical protein